MAAHNIEEKFLESTWTSPVKIWVISYLPFEG
jgi:hypothetical protein